MTMWCPTVERSFSFVCVKGALQNLYTLAWLEIFVWFSHKIDLFRPMCKKQAAWMKMHSHTLTLGGAYGKAEIPGLPYTKQCAAFSFCTRVSWRRKEVKQYLQCLAKVFIPLHFVHVLLCSCLMLNCFKLLFSTSIYTPYTIMVKQKQVFNVFANLLKLKNLNDSIA